MKTFKKILNARGESLIEILIATVIISLTLSAVISAFMNGRPAIVSSWDRTDANLCATYVMEQLKATPYDTIINTYNEKQVDGKAESIPFLAAGEFPNYTISYDLLPYMPSTLDEEVPVERLIQVKVKVLSDGQPLIEKVSLLRKGESS